MMNKFGFIKRYRPSVNLIRIAVLALFLSFSLDVFAGLLKHIDIVDFNQLAIKIISISSYFLGLSVFFGVTFYFILAIELVQRAKHDSVENLLPSIIETYQLHRFLHQSEPTITATATNQSGINYTQKNKVFNRAVKKSVVNIRNDRVMVFIKIPHSQQAQKLLADMEEQLKEQLDNRMVQYYFSPASRVKNELWFEGTKK